MTRAAYLMGEKFDTKSYVITFHTKTVIRTVQYGGHTDVSSDWGKLFL